MSLQMFQPNIFSDLFQVCFSTSILSAGTHCSPPFLPMKIANSCLLKTACNICSNKLNKSPQNYQMFQHIMIHTYNDMYVPGGHMNHFAAFRMFQSFTLLASLPKSWCINIQYPLDIPSGMEECFYSALMSSACAIHASLQYLHT